MDGYRDLYRPRVSAGYYTSPRYTLGYGVEGRRAYALPAADPLFWAYSRVPVGAYARHAPYLPELRRFRRYAPPWHSLSRSRPSNPRRRPSAQIGVQRRPPPVQKLAPRRTPFKKTRMSLPVDIPTPKKGLQRTVPHRKPLQKAQKVGNTGAKPLKSLTTSLVKEVQELHSLYRTGVDPSTGEKSVKPPAKEANGTPRKMSDRNATGQKRKAEAQKRDESPSSAKRLKRKRDKKLAKRKQQEAKKEEKPVVLTPKTLKVELEVLREEEMKAVEVSLALQKEACKVVGEFLGIPEKIEEPEKSAAPDGSVDEDKLDEAQPNSDELQAKLDEAQPNSNELQAKPEESSKPVPLSPEEEIELEEKGYNFFSKLLQENHDLCNLYLEKKDAATFECLVCHSIDPEISKKFANLTNLVMHTSMRKQKRPEHRGYGRAICDILGWESLRAPKRPAKQVNKEGDSVKQTEVEKASEEVKPGEN